MEDKGKKIIAACLQEKSKNPVEIFYNIAKQDFAINGFIKHYPDILIMTQSGKLICAETKGEHLKNDDSREKIALGQVWRTAAGKDYRYYMVFENEENLLPGAMSMSQFIDTVKAL